MSTTLADLIRDHAQVRPDKLALVDDARRLSFGELHARSSRVANALLTAGVAPGDRVGVLLSNRTEYFEVLYGTAKADGIVVALNWRLAAPELATIVADAEPAVLIADEAYADLANAAAEGTATRVVLLGDDYERWLDGAGDVDPGGGRSDDAVVLVLYSSGTTGAPKGIMLTNHNLSFGDIMATDLFRMDEETVHLVVSPLFHIGGVGTGQTSVRVGGTTVLLPDPTPDRIADAIEREGVTHAFFVPAIIQRVVEIVESGGRDVSQLRMVSYGAAPMTEALLRRAISTLSCGFIHCYGMTETGGTVTALMPEEHVPDGEQAQLLRSVGRPLHWLEVRVTNPDTGEEASPGEPGEIWVRGEQNMKGYWNQPETTAQTVVDGGWLRTGDGASRDEAGFFYLKDRIKDMIISGGENIYPAEVENVLADHPAVNDVAVIGVAHEKWGETPKAVVVLRGDAGAPPDPGELIEFTRSRLARYKCPTSVEFVDELPRTPTGKVLKKVLREWYQ